MRFRVIDRMVSALSGLLVLCAGIGLFVFGIGILPFRLDVSFLDRPFVLWQRAVMVVAALALCYAGLRGISLLFRSSKEKGFVLQHTEYGDLSISMRSLKVQSYAVSAHKVHGPKGVGALVLRDGYRIQPMLAGGGQQQNLRSGTENTSGIAGFAAAVQNFPKEAAQQLLPFKKAAFDGLTAHIPELRVLGPLPDEEDAAPHILFIALPPVRAETLVHAPCQRHTANRGEKGDPCARYGNQLRQPCR